MARAVLLDTHIFIWMRAASEKLTRAERTIIDEAPRRYLSIVSLWEVVLLVSLGRIDNDPRLLDAPGHRTDAVVA